MSKNPLSLYFAPDIPGLLLATLPQSLPAPDSTIPKDPLVILISTSWDFLLVEMKFAEFIA